jgi:hypothetical protein
MLDKSHVFNVLQSAKGCKPPRNTPHDGCNQLKVSDGISTHSPKFLLLKVRNGCERGLSAKCPLVMIFYRF